MARISVIIPVYREAALIGLRGFPDVRYARFRKMIPNPFEKG